MLPALFVAHGSPLVALDDDEYNRSLAGYAASLPRPRAVVIVSAHWEVRGQVRVSSSARPPTIHDFGGFPQALYQITYPAPGAPALAADVVGLLRAAGVDAALDPERGLDHGAWVPLRFMYPAANVPVVAVSLPAPRAPSELLAIGAALGQLRERDVMLVGSGGVVHNLRRVVFEDKQAPAIDWAREFDAWVGDKLHGGDFTGLGEYRANAPHAALAVPTSEHFDPALVVAGAARAGERATSVFEGFHHGSLSMRSFAVGAAGAASDASARLRT